MKISLRKLEESIKEKISDIKDKDNQNKIDKIKSLMDVLEDEGKAFQGLAKAAKDAFTEHDYDKLKAEADRFEQMAKDSEAKYKKLEAELKKLEGEKKSNKKEDKKEDKKEKLDEGVWKVGTPQQIQNFIKDINKIKNHYYNIVGSDAVFDGLDSAIIEAERLMNTSDLNENLDEAKNKPHYIDVSADWKDFNGFIDELLPALKKVGVYAVNNPIYEDSDMYGILISKQPITKGDLKALRDEYFGDSEEENLDERKMKKKEEKIVLKLKKQKGDFKKRYGKDAEKVMYATATKLSKNK